MKIMNIVHTVFISVVLYVGVYASSPQTSEKKSPQTSVKKAFIPIGNNSSSEQTSLVTPVNEFPKSPSFEKQSPTSPKSKPITTSAKAIPMGMLTPSSVLMRSITSEFETQAYNAQAFLIFSYADLASAQTLFTNLFNYHSVNSLSDIGPILFFAQQAAEKALKFCTFNFPNFIDELEKTHDTGKLLIECAKRDPMLLSLLPAAQELSFYENRPRYPDEVLPENLKKLDDTFNTASDKEDKKNLIEDAKQLCADAIKKAENIIKMVNEMPEEQILVSPRSAIRKILPYHQRRASLSTTPTSTTSSTSTPISFETSSRTSGPSSTIKTPINPLEVSSFQTPLPGDQTPISFSALPEESPLTPEASAPLNIPSPPILSSQISEPTLAQIVTLKKSASSTTLPSREELASPLSKKSSPGPMSPEPRFKKSTSAKQWLQSAYSDLLAAQILFYKSSDLSLITGYGNILVLCEQSIEKSLKALWVMYKLELTITHDIKKLTNTLAYRQYQDNMKKIIRKQKEESKEKIKKIKLMSKKKITEEELENNTDAEIMEILKNADALENIYLYARYPSFTPIKLLLKSSDALRIAQKLYNYAVKKVDAEEQSSIPTAKSPISIRPASAMGK